jgi:hypothetical protein
MPSSTNQGMTTSNLSSNSIKYNKDLLNINLSSKYNINSCTFIYNSGSASTLGFNPSYTDSTGKINSIKYSCTTSDTSIQALSISLNNVKTMYNLENIHIIKNYPFIGSSKPQTYALALEFTSYSNPLKDKAYIYLPITASSTDNNTFLNDLYNDLNANKNQTDTTKIPISDHSNVTLSDKPLLMYIIPTNKTYYCYNFVSREQYNITNIFFDNNVNIKINSISLIDTILNNSKYTDNVPVNTSSARFYQSSTPINVSETIYSTSSDIYIDCQPTDMVGKDQEQYLQSSVNKSFFLDGDNMVIALTYIAFILFIGLIIYYIYKLPEMFKSKTGLSEQLNTPP